MSSSVLILSGGLDSSVAAFVACRETPPRLALFFDYGQRAAPRERKAAQAVAAELKIPFRPIALPWLRELSHSALTDHERDLPRFTIEDLDDSGVTADSARCVWVPNRNGVFLNVAAAFAESLEAEYLVTGFNAEEALTFPDNSEDFVQVANEFFQYATMNGVKVISYTQAWNKTKIVEEGLKLGVPFEKLWSCYDAGSRQCGSCESCQRSIRAYREVGLWERMQGQFV